MREVLIIGGGASGLAAAIRAAENGENHVTLLERRNRVGHKLLATGNGRCNLSNSGVSVRHYHGEDPDFAAPVLSRYPPGRVLEFFGALGLRTAEEYGGRVYPMSGHAGSVLDVLRLALEKPNVRLETGAAVTAVRREGGGFRALWEGGSARGDALIVACGGCAGSRLGGVTDGYRLLGALGHGCTPLAPALTALRTAPEYPRALKGIRADARLTLLRGEDVLGRERDDVLFTDTGLSGTAVFALSRLVSGRAPATAAALDFFPDTPLAALRADLARRRAQWPQLPANRLLTGTVHSRLGLMLCKYAGTGAAEAQSLPDAALDALARAMKDFRLPVTGAAGFETAQVTAGGMRTAEFDAKSLQSRRVPGLYACGEVLDIDGDCGGYNLHWAWASGLTAGELL